MNILLLYLLKSTLCMGVLYLVFRTLMRKQTFFQLNRVILLSIVAFSLVIPLVHLPQTMQPVVSFQWAPVADKIEVYDLNLPGETAHTGPKVAGQPVETTSPQFAIAWSKLLQMIYLSGLLVALLVSLTGFLNILLLLSKVPAISKDGFRLLIAPGDIPAFSLGRYLFISKSDFETNGDTILTHEKSHIRHGHFYDLLLLEVVKIIYWFNPVIYWLTRDLKAVHEFQADDSTLYNGIDALQYQLLIIQKGVGHQKFALANSFNHCQIKNRIVMMNKQKSNKAWSWKAAAFLPMLALLLMAFGRTGENVPPLNLDFPYEENWIVNDSTKQWNETDFLTLDGLNTNIKMGKIPNWKEPEVASFEKNGKLVTMKKPYFSGFIFCDIQIDSKSNLWIGGSMYKQKKLNWSEFQDSIRSYVDYEVANVKTRPYFHQATINGVIKMSPQYKFLILSDFSTPYNDYQKLLNTIGNTILEVRKQYSNDIYKKDYSQLNANQKEQIDIIIPLSARFRKSPEMREGAIITLNSFYIEDRIEGIVVSHAKKSSSLDELRNKIEIFMKDNPKGMFSVMTANGSKVGQLEAIKEVLRTTKAQNVNYTTFDPIYLNAEEMPIFPGGESVLREWIRKNLKYPEEAKSKSIEGKVFVNFVINSNGKVSEAKIARGLTPELDSEALRVVNEMPEWAAGKQQGTPVRVSLTIPVSYSLK